MRRTRIVAVGLILLVLVGTPLIVSASSTPDFDVYVPENIVEPGEETTIDLEIRNGASVEDSDSDVGESPSTEARDVTIELEAADDDVPIEVKTNETPLQTMSAQTLLSEGFTIAVDENASAGVYELEADIEYTYTSSGGSERTSSDTETIELIVEDRARFDAGNVTSDLVVGDRGVVSLELENTGVENASNAVVQFSSPDENLQAVDPTTDESELQTAGSEEYVGDWAINETVTVAAAMELDENAIARTYPVSVTVQFRDEAGIEQTSREVRVGASTSHEQRFGLENVTSDLHVAEDGTVSGTVTNEGPHPVESAVLIIDDGSDTIVPDFESGLGSGSNVYPRETQFAVGDLAPGESAPFEFRLGIGAEAEAGPRVMEVDVRYRNIYDKVRMTHEPVDIRLDVGPERDEFAIEATDSTLEPGDRKAIGFVVTNQKNETLTDIEAAMFTNDPLENHDDEGFVPKLGPGESATVTFEVSAADGATPQTYPLRMDFRYDDERSKSHLTNTYRIPLEVVEPDDGGISTMWIAAGVGLLVALGAAGWWFRDRLSVPAALANVPGVARLVGSDDSSASSAANSSAGSGAIGGRAVNRGHDRDRDRDWDADIGAGTSTDTGTGPGTGTETAFDEDDLLEADEEPAGEAGEADAETEPGQEQEQEQEQEQAAGTADAHTSDANRFASSSDESDSTTDGEH